MRTTVWTMPVLVLLLASGCQSEGRKRDPFPTRETFAWETATFRVGMSKDDALMQLKDAVPVEEFDPKSKATIIWQREAELASDSWVLHFVSSHPVGPVCIAKLSFAEGAVSRIEIVGESKAVRRETQAYPTLQKFTWSGRILSVGMKKDHMLEHLRRLGERAPPQAGWVSVPNEREAARDVWILGCAGRLAVGNSMQIRLTFKKQVLERIQVISETH